MVRAADNVDAQGARSSNSKTPEVARIDGAGHFTVYRSRNRNAHV